MTKSPSSYCNWLLELQSPWKTLKTPYGERMGPTWTQFSARVVFPRWFEDDVTSFLCTSQYEVAFWWESDDSWNTHTKSISVFIPVSPYSFLCLHCPHLTHQTPALPSSPSIPLCFVPSICAKASPSTESLKRHLEKAWLGSLGRETN